MALGFSELAAHGPVQPGCVARFKVASMASGAVGGSQGLCAAARVAPDGRGGQSCRVPSSDSRSPCTPVRTAAPGDGSHCARAPPSSRPRRPTASTGPPRACHRHPAAPLTAASVADLTRPRAGLRDAQTAMSVRVSAGLAEYGAPRPGGHRTTGQDPDRAKGQKTCRRGRGLLCADTDAPDSRPLHPAGRTRSPGPRAPGAVRGPPAGPRQSVGSPGPVVGGGPPPHGAPLGIHALRPAPCLWGTPTNGRLRSSLAFGGRLPRPPPSCPLSPAPLVSVAHVTTQRGDSPSARSGRRHLPRWPTRPCAWFTLCKHPPSTCSLQSPNPGKCGVNKGVRGRV